MAAARHGRRTRCARHQTGEARNGRGTKWERQETGAARREMLRCGEKRSAGLNLYSFRFPCVRPLVVKELFEPSRIREPGVQITAQ